MIEAYVYGTSKNLISEKEVIKCDNVIKQYKNDELRLSYKGKHKIILSKLATIPDHPYRILIIGGSGSGNTNSLFNLIGHQP